MMQEFQMLPECGTNVPKTRRDVVSPTYGTVEKINGNEVIIYISVTDDHDIFAPVEGYISEIETIDGYTMPEGRTSIFKSSENRRGRVRFTIASNILKDAVIFYVEVGKGYVTNRIRYNVAVDDLVEKGERIGRIILGSRSMIRVPRECKILINIGDTVIGGKTKIGIA